MTRKYGRVPNHTRTCQWPAIVYGFGTATTNLPGNAWLLEKKARINSMLSRPPSNAMTSFVVIHLCGTRCEQCWSPQDIDAREMQHWFLHSCHIENLCFATRCVSARSPASTRAALARSWYPPAHGSSRLPWQASPGSLRPSPPPRAPGNPASMDAGAAGDGELGKYTPEGA